MKNSLSSIPTPIVDVSWLVSVMGAENLVILDASVPPVVPGFESMNGDGELKVIPGARRFDYDKQICKPDSSLPHMMPSPELFEKEVRLLGINEDSVIVVYDDVGLYASPRAWWMLKAMGHEHVAVLEGGLPAWVAYDQAVASAYEAKVSEGGFIASPNADYFLDATSVLAALDDKDCAVLDARSSARFYGKAPEPRAGSRSGHMPNALNLPFVEVIEGGKLKPEEELKQLFEPLASEDKTIITSCGSGITACVLTLAAYNAGYRKLAVYDGSWAEWGAPGDLPVVLE